ncbi:MAG TPA: NAD(P)H-hydrate dehydratase [Gammaproteobacteria bacterium]|nr:NAD(P)H-hydrate dehydratase [Gammaproteobacteria bacterium]
MQAILPSTLYSAEQVREMDRLAIEGYNIPGFTLMSRAATAALNAIKESWPGQRRLLVVCGSGNNGGDGHLLACQARADGFEVCLVLAGSRDRLVGDAARACQEWQACGGECAGSDNLAAMINNTDIIVDALLGTGLQREVSGGWAGLIEQLNQSRQPVLSIDIPSGLNADTGSVMGIAVRADVTVSYIGLKQGMWTASGRDYCGRIIFDDLGVPEEIYTMVKSDKHILDSALLSRLLAARPASCHKGQCGHVLVAGGDLGMPGAARMAGESAARAGAGLVSIATRREHAANLSAGRPELMCHGVETAGELDSLIGKATIIAIGPGLGSGSWSSAILSRILQTDMPLVVDADALNLLAADPVKRGNWILTPHPGEAARLLDCSSRDIQSDRFTAVQAIAGKYDCVAVLKGSGSLVYSQHDEQIYCCRDGNPGMATAGMGDVLTGVIAGLAAQGLSLSEAACCGVYLHANAADRAAQKGERGLLATDLFPYIRQLANPERP